MLPSYRNQLTDFYMMATLASNELIRKTNLHISVRLQNEPFNRLLSGSVNFILTNMDKKMHTGIILVDLQKAFDTLDHGVLFEKMKYFGF